MYHYAYDFYLGNSVLLGGLFEASLKDSICRRVLGNWLKDWALDSNQAPLLTMCVMGKLLNLSIP